MPQVSLKEESRKNYCDEIKSPNTGLCIEQLTLGCLMRIADSLEKTEKPFNIQDCALNYRIEING